jgi:hypothetical protein
MTAQQEIAFGVDDGEYPVLTVNAFRATIVLEDLRHSLLGNGQMHPLPFTSKVLPWTPNSKHLVPAPTTKALAASLMAELPGSHWLALKR